MDEIGQIRELVRRIDAGQVYGEPGLTRMARAILADEISHDMVVDAMYGGAQSRGLPMTREQIFADVKERLPAQADIGAWTRLAVLTYASRVLGFGASPPAAPIH